MYILIGMLASIIFGILSANVYGTKLEDEVWHKYHTDQIDLTRAYKDSDAIMAGQIGVFFTVMLSSFTFIMLAYFIKNAIVTFIF